MVYNPQKLTSYLVFDLLHSKQTRRKDRILGHCMAAGSHSLQRARGGDISRWRREIKIPTPPSPSPRHRPPQRATPRHSITAVHTSRASLQRKCTFQRAINPYCTLFECFIRSEPDALFNVQFHPNP